MAGNFVLVRVGAWPSSLPRRGPGWRVRASVVLGWGPLPRCGRACCRSRAGARCRAVAGAGCCGVADVAAGGWRGIVGAGCP